MSADGPADRRGTWRGRRPGVVLDRRSEDGLDECARQVNLSVEPGTFTVNASANGYVGATTSGVVVVSGQERAVAIALTPLNPGTQGLDPLVIAAIAIVVVIAAVALSAVLLIRRRTKKEAEESRIELPPKT